MSNLNNTQPMRVHSVEVLRAIAAFGVMWYHFTLARPGYELPLWMNETSRFGSYGVQVFFVVSGFVIPWLMWSIKYDLRKNALGFIARRVLRLDPAYFVAILLAVLLMYAATFAPWANDRHFQMPWGEIFSHVAYLPPFLGEVYLNTVFWTLGVEFQYYLGIALLFPLVSHRSRTVRLSLALALASTSLIFEPAEFVTRWGAVFAIGIVVFHQRAELETKFICLPVIAALCAVIAYEFNSAMALVCAGTALIILFVTIRPRSIVSALGDVSYSIYLFHHIIGLQVIVLGIRFLDFPGGGLMTLACALLAATAGACIVHRLIDAPARRLSRKVPWDWRPFARHERRRQGLNLPKDSDLSPHGIESAPRGFRP